MHSRRGQAEALLFGGADSSAGLEGFYGEETRSIILGGHPLHGFDYLCVLALAEQVFGRLLQADDGDSEDGHDEYERATGVPNVSPAHVVGVRADGRVIGAGVVC